MVAGWEEKPVRRLELVELFGERLCHDLHLAIDEVYLPRRFRHLLAIRLCHVIVGSSELGEDLRATMRVSTTITCSTQGGIRRHLAAEEDAGRAREFGDHCLVLHLDLDRVLDKVVLLGIKLVPRSSLRINVVKSESNERAPPGFALCLQNCARNVLIQPRAHWRRCCVAGSEARARVHCIPRQLGQCGGILESTVAATDLNFDNSIFGSAKVLLVLLLDTVTGIFAR